MYEFTIGAKKRQKSAASQRGLLDEARIAWLDRKEAPGQVIRKYSSIEAVVSGHSR